MSKLLLKNYKCIIFFINLERCWQPIEEMVTFTHTYINQRINKLQNNFSIMGLDPVSPALVSDTLPRGYCFLVISRLSNGDGWRREMVHGCNSRWTATPVATVRIFAEEVDMESEDTALV